MEVIVDLGKSQTISRVGAEFLQDQPRWILMPVKVDFEISADGKNFTPVSSVNNNIPDKEATPTVMVFTNSITPQQTRYIKVKAHNYGTLPAWHPGAGGKAWIFCDEIFIQ